VLADRNSETSQGSFFRAILHDNLARITEWIRRSPLHRSNGRFIGAYCLISPRHMKERSALTKEHTQSPASTPDPTGTESREAPSPTPFERDPNLKAREAAVEIARVLHDDKCSDIVVLDVTGLSHVSDYLVIASGTSDRQMQSSGSDAGQIAAKHGYPSYRRSTDDRTTWVLIDCVDVVVHIFEPNTRAHYDLEMLWGDAPHIEWERPEQVSRDRAGLGKG